MVGIISHSRYVNVFESLPASTGKRLLIVYSGAGLHRIQSHLLEYDYSPSERRNNVHDMISLEANSHRCTDGELAWFYLRTPTTAMPEPQSPDLFSVLERPLWSKGVPSCFQTRAYYYSTRYMYHIGVTVSCVHIPYASVFHICKCIVCNIFQHYLLLTALSPEVWWAVSRKAHIGHYFSVCVSLCASKIVADALHFWPAICRQYEWYGVASTTSTFELMGDSAACRNAAAKVGGVWSCGHTRVLTLRHSTICKKNK